MNQASCTACGDQHLCPGTQHPPVRDTGLMTQLREFIHATYDLNPAHSVSTSEAYEDYQRWCVATGAVPFSQRRFVAGVAALPGIRRVKRSTMRFQGLTYKSDRNQGRHALDLFLAGV